MKYDKIKSILIFRYSNETECLICPVDPYSPNFNKDFVSYNVCPGEQEYERIFDLKKKEFIESEMPFIIEYYLDKKLQETTYHCDEVTMSEENFLLFVDNYFIL